MTSWLLQVESTWKEQRLNSLFDLHVNEGILSQHLTQGFSLGFSYCQSRRGLLVLDFVEANWIESFAEAGNTSKDHCVKVDLLWTCACRIERKLVHLSQRRRSLNQVLKLQVARCVPVSHSQVVESHVCRRQVVVEEQVSGGHHH